MFVTIATLFIQFFLLQEQITLRTALSAPEGNELGIWQCRRQNSDIRNFLLEILYFFLNLDKQTEGEKRRRTIMKNVTVAQRNKDELHIRKVSENPPKLFHV